MSRRGRGRAVRVGAGAGYSGDRIEPALELVEGGDLDYLVFECLAERTIALAQAGRRADPAGGYDPLLEERLRAILPAAHRRGVRIVTNMGAANPAGAAARAAAVARELGLKGLKIAAVSGDDVLDAVLRTDPLLMDREGAVSSIEGEVISANAYLGCEPIVEALAQGADLVITGRVGDPSLFLAPLVHEFGWALDDWAMLGHGALVGHLLECAGQLTGGYFADPGFKDVPNLARLGFPLAEVAPDGSAILAKAPGSGGRLSVASCKEQLLYEVLDPGGYIQPDVTLDFREVRFREIGPDVIEVTGAFGWPRPEQLKVSIGYLDGFIGEGQISYAGVGAIERGRLALDIVRERLALTGVPLRELDLSLIGVDSIDRTARSDTSGVREVRARAAGRAATRADADRIGREVEALYTNGPFGGGGVTRSTREVVGVASALIPRRAVRPVIALETV